MVFSGNYHVPLVMLHPQTTTTQNRNSCFELLVRGLASLNPWPQYQGAEEHQAIRAARRVD